jgi:hypothetical protein
VSQWLGILLCGRVLTGEPVPLGEFLVPPSPLLLLPALGLPFDMLAQLLASSLGATFFHHKVEMILPCRAMDTLEKVRAPPLFLIFDFVRVYFLNCSLRFKK